MHSHSAEHTHTHTQHLLTCVEAHMQSHAKGNLTQTWTNTRTCIQMRQRILNLSSLHIGEHAQQYTHTRLDVGSTCPLPSYESHWYIYYRSWNLSFGFQLAGLQTHNNPSFRGWLHNLPLWSSLSQGGYVFGAVCLSVCLSAVLQKNY